MIQTKKIGSLTQLTASEGYIHKLGTDTYVKSIIMLPSESIEAYEEVAEIPPFTKAEYDAKVAELVRQKYSESEEFAVQRKAINAAFSPMTFSEGQGNPLEEYAQYNEYVEQCKVNAVAILSDPERNKEEPYD